MKVIAKISRDRFVCEVGTTEVEKFLNLYYGKMEEMKIGSVIDLAKGHDFAEQAADAMQKTEKFIQSNKVIVESILNGINFLGCEDRLRYSREEADESASQLKNGRDYLMQIQQEDFKVEDALEAFGFGRDGLGTE